MNAFEYLDNLPKLGIETIIAQLKQKELFENTSFDISGITVTINNWPNDQEKNSFENFVLEQGFQCEYL